MKRSTWLVVIPLLALSAVEAQAQAPQVPYHHNWRHPGPGDFPAVVLRNQGPPSVMFTGPFRNVQWDPYVGIANTIPSPGGTYDTHWDAIAYWASGHDGREIHVWDLDNQQWHSVPSPYPATSSKHLIAFPDGRGGVSWEDVTAPGVKNVSGLSGNGWDEEALQLYDQVLTYQYHDGSSWNVAVHDIITDTKLYFAPDLGDETNPDVYEDFVAYADGTGFKFEDYVAGTQTAVNPGGSCAQWDRPKIGYLGEFVAFVGTGCPTGAPELWVWGRHSGNFFFIDYLLNDYAFHVVQEFLAYSDINSEVVLLEIDYVAVNAGGGPVGPQPAPLDTMIRSGEFGSDPALATPSGYSVVFHDGNHTREWAVGGGTRSIGPLMRELEGHGNLVAGVDLMGQIWIWNADYDAWHWAGLGRSPTIHHGRVFFEDFSSGADVGAGYWTLAGAGVLVANDGIDQLSLQTSYDRLAYQHWDGNDWEITVEDFFAGTQYFTTSVNTDDDITPDLFEDVVVFVNATSMQVEHHDFGLSSSATAHPSDPACTLHNPRVNSVKNLVFYEERCGGTSKLLFFDTNTSSYWYVDDIKPGTGNTPQYAVEEDYVAYVDASGEIVFINIDLGSL